MSKVLDFSEEKIENAEVVKVLRQIDGHCVNILEKLDRNDTLIAQLLQAFPASDLEGHRRYHQTMIDILNEKRSLKAAIKEKTIAGLVWAGIVLVSLSIWHEIIDTVKKTPPREEISRE